MTKDKKSVRRDNKIISRSRGRIIIMVSLVVLVAALVLEGIVDDKIFKYEELNRDFDDSKVFAELNELYKIRYDLSLLNENRTEEFRNSLRSHQTTSAEYAFYLIIRHYENDSVIHGIYEELNSTQNYYERHNKICEYVDEYQIIMGEDIEKRIDDINNYSFWENVGSTFGLVLNVIGMLMLEFSD